MSLPNHSIEEWSRININVPDIENPPHYEVSSFGRLKSFQTSEDGKILRGSVIQGYRSLNIRLPKGKSFNRYIHKLVAEFFVDKGDDSKIFVIHKDFDKLNNIYTNLAWNTKEEMLDHNRKNPNVINRPRPVNSKNYKLNESKVLVIKKMLKSDKSRLKMIAKQFGITHTQLNRIRSGENWGHVKLKEET
ncbi:MAG: hypothetical protein ACI9IP_002282 [Arcticibacterium sp.]|jgi:hypothetical protein